MLKKMMMFAGLLGGSALFSGQATAAADWGPCFPVNGTQIFTTSFDHTITDTSKNASGTAVDNFYTWRLGTTYNGTCECPAEADRTTPYPPEYYKTTSDLPKGDVVAGKQYYTINKYLGIAASVYVHNNNYVDVPFSDVSNKANNGTTDCVSGSYTSGARGKLSLYIIHPFVGEQIIPQVRVVSIFGTKKPGLYGSQALAEVYVSGRVVVPQGCELSTGSTLEIPFGEFQAHDFKDRKGQMPTGAASITKELQFKCTNISDGVKIYLNIEGTPNENDSNAISMGNPDIGAIIKGEGGNVLIPNSVAFEQEMKVSELVDDTHRVASTKLTFEPISTTGKMPATGDYEGIATLRIDVE